MGSLATPCHIGESLGVGGVDTSVLFESLSDWGCETSGYSGGRQSNSDLNCFVFVVLNVCAAGAEVGAVVDGLDAVEADGANGAVGADRADGAAVSAVFTVKDVVDDAFDAVVSAIFLQNLGDLLTFGLVVAVRIVLAS